MDRKKQKRMEIRLLETLWEQAYVVSVTEYQRSGCETLVSGHLEKVMFLLQQCTEVLEGEVD